ncbi:MAG: hypothetical protein WDA27_05290 [Actinomycetota bacterium]
MSRRPFRGILTLRRARAGSEEGMALVLALVFLSLFGIAIASLLGFAEASFRTTIAVREQRAAVYAAEGAVQGGINSIRGNLAQGQDPAGGGTCTSFSLPSTNGVSATTTCTGQSGSGTIPGPNPNNHPPNAILTLSTDSTENGIEQAAAASSLAVSGPVFSHSNITASGLLSTIAVTGQVSAVGDCLGTITSTVPPLKCANKSGGAANPADAPDPDYAKATASVPTYQAVPSCPGPASIITFTPGMYDDVVALNALTNGACTGALLYFPAATSPAGVGVYYFNFRNGSSVWTINDATVNVVGGTPKNWLPLLPRPIVPIPGGCKLETDAAPNDGVQFIFGRSSRMDVQAGMVELCAQPATADQEIAVYGLKTGSGTSTAAASLAGSHDPAATSGFTNPTQGVTNDASSACSTSTCASASLTGSSAYETLREFTTTPSLPAGSRITSATLRVGHEETVPLSVASLTATVTPGGGGSALSCTFSASSSRTLGTCDLLAKGMDNGPGVLSGMTVRYTAQATSLLSTTAWLDGVDLAITYIPRAFEAQDGCIVVPYTEANQASGTACAVLKSSGLLSTLAVQGTVYAPLAPVDVAGLSLSAQVFGRGVVARVVRMAVAPAGGFTGFPVGTPSNSPANDRVVLFVASVGGADRLRALVTFGDLGGVTPGATVTVNSWSVLR